MRGYQFQYCGECLGGLVPNGTILTADPDVEFDIGDIVAVVLNLDDPGPFAAFMNGISMDGFAGVTKLYLGKHTDGRGATVYRLGQINPPLVTPIPESAIESISKIVDGGIGPEAERPTAEDIAAMELLRPFISVERPLQ